MPKRPVALAPLAAVLLATALAACEDDNGLDSDTAMLVEDAVHLEFRVMEGAEGTPDQEACMERHPETGGFTTMTQASPDETTSICVDVDGYPYIVPLSEAVLTGQNIEYVDFDYGTAGLATVYVVFDADGIATWKAIKSENEFKRMQLIVNGQVFISTGMDLSSNDILNIRASSLEEAESIAETLSTGVIDRKPVG